MLFATLSVNSHKTLGQHSNNNMVRIYSISFLMFFSMILSQGLFLMLQQL